MIYLIFGVYGLLFLAWLGVLLMNVIKLVQVMRLEGDDKPVQRGWIVFGLSAFSLFFGCCPAVIAWVVMEWVYKPLDPFEDSLGTIHLFGLARTNVGFIIVVCVAGIVLGGLLQLAAS